VAPGPQVILVVGITTSQAALTSVVKLDGAQEVNKTNRFYYKLANTGFTGL
jgi:hypothetical protein